MVPLDIFSDPVCPWCYIGKAYLDQALERYSDHPFVVEWHPFQLNPDMPPEGVDRRSYLEAKFGGRANAVRTHARVSEAAAQAGVEIDFERMPRVPNTLNAHRLIHWAGLEAKQTAMKAALLRAYFRDGRDIGDRKTLTAIAGDVGLDPVVIARLLASDANVADIRARDAHARARGITAVPTFIVARSHALQGAQPAGLWDQVIAEVNARLRNAHAAAP